MNLDSLKSQWGDLPDWQKLLAVVVVTFAIAYGIYMLFIGDKVSEKENLNRQVTALEREVLRLKKASKPEIKKKLTKKLKEIEVEIEKLNKKLAELKNIIPEKENSQYLLTFFSSAVQENGLILNSFKISEPEDVILSTKEGEKGIRIVKGKKTRSKKEIRLKRIVLTLNLAGDLGSLYKLIKTLGKSERYIRVDKVSIKKKKKFLSIKLKVSTFYLPERS